jgi:uncharacterized membrane protein
LYFIQRDAFRYLDYSPGAYRHHWELRWWLIPHILGAGPALLAGPLQFSGHIRARWPILHRTLGRVYVFGGLVAAPAAFRLALGSKCELCVPPLMILATLWFASTAVAFWAARKRTFELHRQFMIRSYVLMCAFVVIRLADFIPLPLAVVDDEARRSVLEWLCWVVPLLVTEAWLSWVPAVRRTLSVPSNKRMQLTKPAQATELRS